MPKRKNPIKNQPADFRKVKRKVGKKLQPTNTTHAKVHIRALQISNQSVGQTKDSAALTVRHLSLDDLKIQCHHYSSSVRKDSLQGMKEIFVKFPDTFFLQLSSVFDVILELIVDEERSVRQALLSLLQIMFRSLDEKTLRPFASRIVWHVCSAMSHISHSVRIDSLLFFQLLVNTYPRLLWPLAKDIFPVLQMVLVDANAFFKGKSTGGRNNKSINNTSCPQLLSCVFSFIKLSPLFSPKLPGVQTITPLNDVRFGLHRRHVNQTAPCVTYMENVRVFQKRVPQKNTESPLQLSHPDKPGDTVISFCYTCIPILLECWLECGIGTKSSLHFSDSLLLQLQHILGILLAAFRTLDDMEPSSFSKLLLSHEIGFFRHMFVYFPFPISSSSLSKNPRLTQLVSINLYLAELMTYFHQSNSRAVSSDSPNNDLFSCFSHVIDLTNDTHLFQNAMTQHTQLTYLLHRLISCIDFDKAYQLICSLYRCFLDSHVLSNTRRQLVSFIGELVHSDYGRIWLNQDCVQRWVLSFPGYIVQANIATNNSNNDLVIRVAETTLPILSYLARTACGRIHFGDMTSDFIALFASAESKMTSSVFLCFPATLQVLTVSILNYMTIDAPALLEALSYCCKSPSVSKVIRELIYHTIVIHDPLSCLTDLVSCDIINN